MAVQQFVEGEILQSGEQDDPDLNQAFWEFTDSIKAEANAGGSIAVFEVPTDAGGMARPKTFNKAKLFSVPVGACTFDDICDRVMREFMEPGQKMMIQLMGRKDGQRGLILNRLVTLRRGKDSQAGGSNGTTSGEVAQMLRMMNQQRAQERTELLELLSQNRGAPQTDPMDRALAIADRIAALSTRTANPPSANDPNNVMNQMMVMMMTTMMKNFMRGMGADKEEKPETTWLKDIAELAKPLLEAKTVAEKAALVREQRMLQHEKSAPPAPVVAPEQTTPKPEGARGTKEENEMKLLAMLIEMLPMLIDNVVSKDGDPVATAKLLMDGISEEDTALNDALYQLIQSPPAEFNAKLCLADKRAAQHAEWFEAMRGAMLSAFDPDTRTPAGSAA